MSLSSLDRRVAELRKAMAEAAGRDDFERAAALRDEIQRLLGRPAKPAGEGDTPDLVHQPVPGAMGLGTHLPIAERPKGWKPPPKPDLGTTRTRRGRRPAK